MTCDNPLNFNTSIGLAGLSYNYSTMKTFFTQLFRDFLIIIVLLILFGGSLFAYMIYTSTPSFQGPPPALTLDEQAVLTRLKTHINFLARDFRGRNNFFENSLDPYKNYLIDQFRALGYTVSLQDYRAESELYAGTAQLVTTEQGGEHYSNIVATRLGLQQPTEILVIGAHYDTIPTSPGANDNASGVAALLELARLLQTPTFAKTLRFVAFVNEEPPFFQTEAMGSLVYAKQCQAQGESIVGMMALETIGYFTDTPDSQHYPPGLNLFYPTQGNFIAFVSNLSSRDFLHQAINAFRQHANIPSEAAALPAFIPGVAWSDHWSFWQQGYPAIMITDTAPYRYPHYHSSKDTPEQLNYESMTRVVMGCQKMIETLSNPTLSNP